MMPSDIKEMLSNDSGSIQVQSYGAVRGGIIKEQSRWWKDTLASSQCEAQKQPHHATKSCVSGSSRWESISMATTCTFFGLSNVATEYSR